MQTSSGPSIVLQGLHGYSLSPQQLALVQHQVKQQLLKGKMISLQFSVLCLLFIYILTYNLYIN